ncbi:hypothetical protein NDU88_004354 [Pleurodeles waltl]|uniref:Uncharacterized protein n=1 Tax=Pleurodeles waltl TaxID=8319 RepID=A0AAV7T9B7_PLEWA|nr:hypothetical protein NDU88_004354 [Pleurodeles waltl]
MPLRTQRQAEGRRRNLGGPPDSSGRRPDPRGSRGASDPSTGDRLWHQREVPETDPSPQTDPGCQRLTPATGRQREALETDPSPETDPGHRASETDPGHQRLTSRHHNLTSGTRERPQRLTPGTRERDRVPETDPEHPRQDPHQRLTPGTIPWAQGADPGHRRQPAAHPCRTQGCRFGPPPPL